MDDTAAVPNDEVNRPALNSLLLKIYLWVILALIITCGSADLIQLYWKNLGVWVDHNPGIMLTLLSAEMTIAWAFSFFLKFIPRWAAGLILLLYSILNGTAISIVFQFFKVGPAVILFGSVAAIFLVLSVSRSIFKLDLTGLGGFFVTSLSGLISTVLLNLYLHSASLCWWVTIIGILIFIITVLWHRNRMNKWINDAAAGFDITRRTPVYGALVLYLEFIIFIFFFLRYVINDWD